MADPQRANEEFGRRLAAARGYSRASATQWAEEVMEGRDRGTLRRYELGEIDPSTRPWAIENCMKATGLPREFFVIDFDDLPEMVAAWRQVQAGSADRLTREQERDEEDVLPDDSNDSPSEEQDPDDEDR